MSFGNRIVAIALIFAQLIYTPFAQASGETVRPSSSDTAFARLLEVANRLQAMPSTLRPQEALAAIGVNAQELRALIDQAVADGSIRPSTIAFARQTAKIARAAGMHNASLAEIRDFGGLQPAELDSMVILLAVIAVVIVIVLMLLISDDEDEASKL